MEGIPEKRSRYSPKSVIFMAVKTKPDSLNCFRGYRESTLQSYYFLLKKQNFLKFSNFEAIMSSKLMRRYVNACGGDTRKAMTLYRYNLRLSQEVFTVISCYEVALRNAIDVNLSKTLGTDWLRDAILPGGIFDNAKFSGTTRIMKKAYAELNAAGLYSPSKMLSAMEFGVWKYMFSATQYRATGRTLLQVFPKKPKSTPLMQYNNLFIFNELDAINRLRNRIAHHEPICFLQNNDIVSTAYLRGCYNRIVKLFSWMDISSKELLFGMDHVLSLCQKIDGLK